MIDEFVLDTNVALHADNPNEPRHEASLNLLIILLDRDDINLCVDEGFDPDEAKNRSIIASEYFDRFYHGSLGSEIIKELVLDQRVIEKTRNVPNGCRRFINRILRNNRDKTFLRVSYNSNSKVLVSHDFHDFTEDKRKAISRELSIEICEAIDFCNTVEQ